MSPVTGQGWKHYHTDAHTLLRTIPDGSVNLILTDPPYFRVKGEDWDNQWNKPEVFLAWLETVVQEYRRVLAPNGSLYLFAWPKIAAHVELMIGRHFRVLSSIAWVKRAPYCPVHPGNGTIGKTDMDLLRNYFPRQERCIFAEHIFDPFLDKERVLRQEAFAPLGRYFQENREAAGLTRNDLEVGLGFVTKANPERGTALACRWEQGEGIPKADGYERLRAYLRTYASKPELMPLEYWQIKALYEQCRVAFEAERAKWEHLRRPFYTDEGQYMPYSDAWFYAPPLADEAKHSCEKPLDMLTQIIRVSSNPGDTVLDTFAGSGSGGAAAILTGREFIGCEKSGHWHGVGVRNMRAAEIACATRVPTEAQPEPGPVDLGTIADLIKTAEQPALF